MYIANLEVCSHDLPLPIDEVLEEDMVHDYQEWSLRVLEFLNVSVFDSADDLVIKCLIHSSYIFLDSV